MPNMTRLYASFATHQIYVADFLGANAWEVCNIKDYDNYITDARKIHRVYADNTNAIDDIMSANFGAEFLREEN